MAACDLIHSPRGDLNAASDLIHSPRGDLNASSERIHSPRGDLNELESLHFKATVQICYPRPCISVVWSYLVDHYQVIHVSGESDPVYHLWSPTGVSIGTS